MLLFIEEKFEIREVEYFIFYYHNEYFFIYFQSALSEEVKYINIALK